MLAGGNAVRQGTQGTDSHAHHTVRMSGAAQDEQVESPGGRRTELMGQI